MSGVRLEFRDSHTHLFVLPQADLLDKTTITNSRTFHMGTSDCSTFNLNPEIRVFDPVISFLSSDASKRL